MLDEGEAVGEGRGLITGDASGDACAADQNPEECRLPGLPSSWWLLYCASDVLGTFSAALRADEPWTFLLLFKSILPAEVSLLQLAGPVHGARLQRCHAAK